MCKNHKIMTTNKYISNFQLYFEIYEVANTETNKKESIVIAWIEINFFQ